MSDEGAKLLEELMRFRPEGLTANGWAVKAGVSRTIWADLRRHGNPSRRTLEKLLAAADVSLAEFEALRAGPAVAAADNAWDQLAEPSPNWRPAPLATLRILGSEPAGSWGDPTRHIEQVRLRSDEAVGSVARPASLAGDKQAYALTIIGDAMWPRFRPGRRVVVSPNAPVAIGDDVLVLLADGNALIKELVRRSTGAIELRQFNPDVTFQVDAAEVAAIQKVVGEAI